MSGAGFSPVATPSAANKARGALASEPTKIEFSYTYTLRAVVTMITYCFTEKGMLVKYGALSGITTEMTQLLLAAGRKVIFIRKDIFDALITALNYCIDVVIACLDGDPTDDASTRIIKHLQTIDMLMEMISNIDELIMTAVDDGFIKPIELSKL